VPIPAEHRERAVGEAEALDILRCGPEVLASLRRQGLPPVADGADGSPRFDYHDLVNLGLHAGCGASLGEVGERVLLRFAAQPPERWTGPRRWELLVEHRCVPAGQVPGAWTAALPAPEATGGRLESWRAEQRDHALRLAGRLEATGARRAVRHPAVRRLYREWLGDVASGRLRFQWLPRSLGADPERAARLGLTDCVSASLRLRRQLGELGLEARSRQGHVLGLVSVPHAWAEFRDADGRWKFLDPILAVAARRAGHGGPEFDEFCLGSQANGVVAWDREAGEELAAHGCGAARVATEVVGARVR